jgi:uncharacterized sodium:solute symporter family permease YidK
MQLIKQLVVSSFLGLSLIGDGSVFDGLNILVTKPREILILLKQNRSCSFTPFTGMMLVQLFYWGNVNYSKGIRCKKEKRRTKKVC